MKQTLLLFLFIISAYQCYSQSKIEEKNRKYFIGGSYGMGTARWYSNFNSSLYDTSGNIIQSGDIKLKAQNPCRLMNFEVIGPISNSLRIGLGVAFEDYYLNKILIQSKGSDKYMLFEETLTVNKVFIQAEFPINMRQNNLWSLGANTHLGYFSYNGLKRYNFFGTKLGNRFLVSLALMADYKVFDKTYIFIMPNVEYKFFKTSPKELPTEINHNIINYSISAGIRMNLYIR